MAAARFSERLRGTLTAIAGAIAVAAIAVVYPWVLDALLTQLGIRGLAIALFGALCLTLMLRGGTAGGRRAWTAVLAALLAWAAIHEDLLALRLVPAFVYAYLAGLAANSLRTGGSLIEDAAFWLVPAAPDFIRGYCRGLTALWSVFFAVAACAIAGLAVAGAGEAWLRFSSRDLWIAMGILTVAEFFFRKTWFRHYFWGGPFERFWSRIFPAERTARGRQSMAYIEEYRARMARGGAASTEGSR